MKKHNPTNAYSCTRRACFLMRVKTPDLVQQVRSKMPAPPNATSCSPRVSLLITQLVQQLDLPHRAGRPEAIDFPRAGYRCGRSGYAACAMRFSPTLLTASGGALWLATSS